MDETTNPQTDSSVNQMAQPMPVAPATPTETAPTQISSALESLELEAPAQSTPAPSAPVEMVNEPPVATIPAAVSDPVPSAAPATPETATYSEIDIKLIQPNPWQPRKIFKEEKLAELAASIKEHGILQPLVVMPTPDGKYQLIVGERRLRASQIAGLTKVPAIIRDPVEEQNKLELALIENIQRHNLDPIEEAQAYQQLADIYHLTQEGIAKKVGKNRTTVTNTLRLLNLPLKIQRAVAENVITEGHARAILGVTGMERQLAMLDLIIKDNLTVRQVEDKVREIMDRPKQVKAPRQTTDPEAAAIENELRGKLGTKVKVSKSGEAGKIMIEFFSKEELDAFLSKIAKLES
jgi:ParB family chromosome partitioning protein